jgi:hypothetical protein
MKATLTFKNPDYFEDLGDVQPTAAERKRLDKLKRKFLEYDEYVVVELDTETGTATVMPV